MDTLDFPPASFDTIISVDTFYMPGDLRTVLRRLVEMLRPGGEILAYYSNMVWDPAAGRAALLPENTPLGEALRAERIPFRTWDVSAQTYALMQRRRQVGEALRAEFEVEGNQGLYEHILAESVSSPEPYDPETCFLSRYLYHIFP
jgi:SAM-dependent methyltransferase